MARKRKKLEAYNYQSAEYWNRLLVEEGLPVDRGKSKKLLYIGGPSEVENLEGFLRTNTGRVRPSGTGDFSQDDEENRE